MDQYFYLLVLLLVSAAVMYGFRRTLELRLFHGVGSVRASRFMCP
jgi:hypothetical protein